MQAEEALNITQQVLRTLVMALVAHGKIDKLALGATLEALSAHPSIEPAAEAMLRDLAAGLAMVGSAGMRKT